MYGEEVVACMEIRVSLLSNPLFDRLPFAPAKRSGLEGARLLRHHSDVFSYQSDVKRTLQLGLQGRVILRDGLAFKVVPKRPPIGLKEETALKHDLCCWFHRRPLPHKHPIVNVYTITNRLTVEAGMLAYFLVKH